MSRVSPVAKDDGEPRAFRAKIALDLLGEDRRLFDRDVRAGSLLR